MSLDDRERLSASQPSPASDVTRMLLVKEGSSLILGTILSGSVLGNAPEKERERERERESVCV